MDYYELLWSITYIYLVGSYIVYTLYSLDLVLVHVSFPGSNLIHKIPF